MNTVEKTLFLGLVIVALSIILLLWTPPFLRRFAHLIAAFFWEVFPWIVIIFLAIQFIAILIFGVSFWPTVIGILIWMMIVTKLFTSGSFSVDVKINECAIFKGMATGWIYSKYPGFNWLSLGQQYDRTIPTDKHITLIIQGDSEFGDDTMHWNAVIQYVVNITENRYSNMRKYVQVTPDNIKEEVTLLTNSRINEWAFELAYNYRRLQNDPDALTPDTLSGSEGAKQTRLQALSISDFITVMERTGIKIEKAVVDDINNSEATREAIKSQRAMTAIDEAVGTLMNGNNPPTSIAEAYKIVKARMLPGYQEIEITSQSPGQNPQVVITPRNRSNNP